MTKAVFCLTDNIRQAEVMIDELKSSGVANTDISVLFPDKGSKRDFVHEKETKAPEGYSVGVGAGGIIGGVLGWLVGIGALAIPGLGPFIAAGPIMAALSGGAIGMALGGLTGALIGLGMPEIVAKQYEEKIKSGNLLISVSSDSKDKTSQIKEIMASFGGKDICTSEECKVGDKAQTESASSHIDQLQKKLKEQTYSDQIKGDKEHLSLDHVTGDIKANWSIIKGKLKQKYAQLTDDDLTYVSGKEEELIGRLQKKLDITADQVRSMLTK